MRKALIISLASSQSVFLLLMPVWMRLIPYLHPIFFFVIWICVTSLVFFIVFYIKRVKVRLPRFIGLAGTFFYTVGLLILLFFRPANQSYQDINLIPFDTLSFYVTGNVSFLIAFYNVAANVLLFIPYGILCLLLIGSDARKSRLFLIPILVISLIETLQYLTHRGSLDVDDLLLNVLGVYIGYALYPLIRKVIVFR